MTDPEFGDAYGLPNVEKLYKAFYMMRMMTAEANKALEKFGVSLLQTSMVMRIRLAYQEGRPWILHHILSGLEYTVAGYRAKDGMFLVESDDDDLRRACPMQHVLDGYYYLWGDY